VNHPPLTTISITGAGVRTTPMKSSTYVFGLFSQLETTRGK
jgi:hypothetical protein